MPEPLTVLGLSGSLRKDSFNTALLRELRRLAPADLSLELADYRDLPLYDGDLEAVATVEALRDRVAQADAVLIATPEYNYSIPGGLKNALDWLSRPAYESVFARKPVGVLSTSPSPIGGARAQGHLKTVLGGMVADLFPHPEVAIGAASQRVREGRIVDADTEALLARYIERFARWARRDADRSAR